MDCKQVAPSRPRLRRLLHNHSRRPGLTPAESTQQAATADAQPCHHESGRRCPSRAAAFWKPLSPASSPAPSLPRAVRPRIVSAMTRYRRRTSAPVRRSSTSSSAGCRWRAARLQPRARRPQGRAVRGGWRQRCRGHRRGAVLRRLCPRGRAHPLGAVRPLLGILSPSRSAAPSTSRQGRGVVPRASARSAAAPSTASWWTSIPATPTGTTSPA